MPDKQALSIGRHLARFMLRLVVQLRLLVVACGGNADDEAGDCQRCVLELKLDDLELVGCCLIAATGTCGAVAGAGGAILEQWRSETALNTDGLLGRVPGVSSAATMASHQNRAVGMKRNCSP